jgi:hypothetical protein
MSAMSDYLEVEIRKHIFRTGSFTKPTVLAIGLFTVAPSDAGGGTEVSGGNYARVQRDPLDANWTAPDGTGGVTKNAAAVTFPAPNADWGQVVAFGIFDNTSGGNLLIHASLTTPKTVNNGDPAPSFPIDALVVTFA